MHAMSNADYPPSLARHSGDDSRIPHLMITLLWVCGIASATIGTTGSLMLLVLAAPRVTAMNWLLAVVLLVGGLSLGAVLWGLGWLAGRPAMWLPRSSSERILPVGHPHSPPAPGSLRQISAHRPDDRKLSELSQRLDELQRMLLLSPKQLDARRREYQQEVERRFTSQIEQALEDQDFALARNLLTDYRSTLPGYEGQEELETRIEQARDKAESEQFSRRVQAAESYMAVSNFRSAEQTARQLLDEHPDSPGAKALLQRVQREREAYDRERLSRLYREVEQHVTARRWSKAVEAGQTLLDAYPETTEADLVSAHMPTLKDNARIEEVREYRDGIRDMIERRRYAEAAELARQVVERYPETAAANELRQQLPRLMELSQSRK